MTEVRFFRDRRAPGMVQATLCDPALLTRVLAIVTANGGPAEETALLGWEDIRLELQAPALFSFRPAPEPEVTFSLGFTHELYTQLADDWDVIIALDAFDAVALYGYGAADALLKSENRDAPWA